MICKGQSITEIVAKSGGEWPGRVAYMKPNHILELGTGQGASGALIMKALPAGSRFTTINYDYPQGYGFGEQLYPWNGDERLTIIIADTVDLKTVRLVKGKVDLLFIDSHHEAWVAATELRNFQWVLEHGAIVIIDDLSHNDMCKFWDSIPYEKVRQSNQGVFRYDATWSYSMMFPRGKTPKEEAGL